MATPDASPTVEKQCSRCGRPLRVSAYNPWSVPVQAKGQHICSLCSEASREEHGVDGLFERDLPPESEEALLRYVRLLDPTYPSVVDVDRMVVAIWEALQAGQPAEACRELRARNPIAFRRAARQIVVTDGAGIADAVPDWLSDAGLTGTCDR